MRAAIFVLCALAASARADTPKRPPAAAPTLAGCPARGSIASNTQLAADLKTTYELGNLRVCVESAMYPLMKRGGHSLYSCFSVAFGKDENRFCGEGNLFADFHGHRIHVSLRKPRFTASCDVWLQIEPAPAPKSV